MSPKGRLLWRRVLVPHGELPTLREGAFSRDGRTYYVFATGRDGRSGVWAVPVAGGAPRLVIASDDPALQSRGWLSVSPDRLYLTVSEYESDVWVARLRY